MKARMFRVRNGRSCGVKHEKHSRQLTAQRGDETLESHTVLIVEDETRVAEYVEKAVIHGGYVVVDRVPTGEQAIEVALEKRPDVILMDIALAGPMDGIQAADAIHSEIEVPIIYLTGRDESIVMDRARLTVPYSYLFKPVREKDLRFAIEMALYRSKMENRLREGEERYRKVVESQTELVCRFSTDGTVNFVNEAYCRYFGIEKEQIEETDFFSRIMTDDSLDMFSSLASSDLSKDSVIHECQAIVNGGTRWMEWNIRAIFDALEQVLEFQAVGRDITDRKRAEEALARMNEDLDKRVKERTAELTMVNRELRIEVEARRASEERFKAIFESSPDCIFIKDKKGLMTHVNPSMEVILNRPSSQLVGMTEEQIFGKGRSDQFSEMDRRALNGDTVEFEHTRTINGLPYTFQEARVPLRTKSGQVNGICGIARNLTDWKRLGPQERLAGSPSYKSKAMCETMNKAMLVARSDSIVVLTGESGSGKDYLARFIHDQSANSAGPFFTINCAAVPNDLAESELFGHEAGAYTGAQRRKRGLLELAEGGTLVLNEIGELPLQVQAKLLTFLDTRSFTRVGGERQIHVNARLIAATNRDLEEEVSRGTFRADLLYRLQIFSIRVPPLRQRKKDIPILAQEALDELAIRRKLSVVPEIDPTGLEKLVRYKWPGNVRELRNVLERALILFEGGPFIIPELEPQRNPDSLDQTFQIDEDQTLQEATHKFKAQLVRQALDRCGGNRTKASQLLGISRVSLRKYLP
jgi:PAS domain S-box-containing protein